jgi:CubicO group peptidase (beta-lactamase class C family)
MIIENYKPMKMKYLLNHTFIAFVFLYIVLSGCSSSADNSDTYKDGLSRSTPEEQGVPSETIAHFFQMIEEKGFEVHGLMMLRHGKVIAEHWWAPYAPQYQHAMYSATKTITAVAIGFAVQEGLLNVDDKVVSFFPDLLPDTISPQLAELSVRHLLTMSVGHASTFYAGSGERQVRSFLAAPFSHEPGTVWAYDITASHMLSRIITKVSGVTILDFLKTRLFDPLGIEDVVWEMDNDGCNMGNGGSHMKTSDLAKMGLFLLNKGKWNGKQLLNPEWIEEASSIHIYQNNELTPEEIRNATDDAAVGYGYQIWRGRHNSFRAIGAMNQLIMVIPDYDFVLVCHSGFRDETGLNNLIYGMLPSMSDKPLRADRSFDLNEAIAGYEMKRPFDGISSGQVTMSTRRYQMDVNEDGIRSVLFRFNASGDCFVTLITDDAVHNIPFGLDRWLYGSTDRTLSFSRSVYTNTMGITPVSTAGLCSWKGEDQLAALYLSMFNAGASEKFLFTFNDDKLLLEIEAPVMSPGRGLPGIHQPEPKNIVINGIKTIN